MKAAPARCDVVLPVRDAAPTLAESLESIRGQTMRDFRCIVVDDGSRDESPRIAMDFALRDPRFVLVRRARAGIVAALNDGLTRATAPVVVRADADDLNDPRRFAFLLRHLEMHPEVNAVASRVRFFTTDAAGLRFPVEGDLAAYETWLNACLLPRDIARDLFVESPLPHPAVAMRTKAVAALRGYREGPFPEDYDLWLRGWRAGWRFAKAPEQLVLLRDHPGRLTRTEDRYRAAAFLRCKVEHLVAARKLVGGEVIVWGAGRDGVRTAREFKRRGVGVRSFVDIAETKIGRRVAGAEIRGLDTLDTKPGCLVVVAVGVKGARAQIRAHLGERGYFEMESFAGGDFVCFG